MTRKAIWLSLYLIASVASAQNPQSQSAPTYAVNAKYVNGVAPGYAPTAGSGLTLNLGAGTANCTGTIETYAGGTLSMTASATNYVYLNTAASCAPAVKTSAFTSSDIPLAVVVAGSAAITSITDDRTPFTVSSGGSGSGTVTPSPQYTVFTQPNSGSSATATGNTNLTADSAGDLISQGNVQGVDANFNIVTPGNPNSCPGAGGSGATILLTVSGGAVTACTVTNAGSGYLNLPPVYSLTGTWTTPPNIFLGPISGGGLSSCSVDPANPGTGVTSATATLSTVTEGFCGPQLGIGTYNELRMLSNPGLTQTHQSTWGCHKNSPNEWCISSDTVGNTNSDFQIWSNGTYATFGYQQGSSEGAAFMEYGGQSVNSTLASGDYMGVTNFQNDVNIQGRNFTVGLGCPLCFSNITQNPESFMQVRTGTNDNFGVGNAGVAGSGTSLSLTSYNDAFNAFEPLTFYDLETIFHLGANENIWLYNVGGTSTFSNYNDAQNAYGALNFNALSFTFNQVATFDNSIIDQTPTATKVALTVESTTTSTADLIDVENNSAKVSYFDKLGGLYIPYIGQMAANNYGGTCAMAAATSCTITLAHTYTTPVCIVTQQSATLTGGAAGCTVSGATVTVTAAVANSETWGVLVFGNPT